MVTELKPDLKKLPFEDFVNVVCRPMVSPAALEEEVKQVFTLFSGSGAVVTSQTLHEAMGSLDLPVSKLLVKAAHPQTDRRKNASSPPRLHLPTCVRAALLASQSEEMVREADLDRDGKMGMDDFLKTVIT